MGDGEVGCGHMEVTVEEDVNIDCAVVVDRAAVGAEGGLFRAAKLPLNILENMQQRPRVKLGILSGVWDVVTHHAVQEVGALESPGLCGDYIRKGCIMHLQRTVYQLDSSADPIFLTDIVTAQSEI